MICWAYKVIVVEDGMAAWDDGSGHDKALALNSALRLLGSQGFELAGILEDSRKLGHKLSHTFIFKRPEGKAAP